MLTTIFDPLSNFFALARQGIATANAVIKGVEHLLKEQPDIIRFELSKIGKEGSHPDYIGWKLYIDPQNSDGNSAEHKLQEVITPRHLISIGAQFIITADLVKWAMQPKSGYKVIASDRYDESGRPTHLLLVRRNNPQLAQI